MAGLYTCMDGQSIPVYFKRRVANGVNYDFVYETSGPLSLVVGGATVQFQKVTSCNGLGYYRLTDCFGANQYDCDRDVYIYIQVTISCPFPASGSTVSCAVSWAVQGKDAFTPCTYVIRPAVAAAGYYYSCPLLPMAFTADFISYFDTCVLNGAGPQAGIVYGSQADGAFTVDITE